MPHDVANIRKKRMTTVPTPRTPNPATASTPAAGANSLFKKSVNPAGANAKKAKKENKDKEAAAEDGAGKAKKQANKDPKDNKESKGIRRRKEIRRKVIRKVVQESVQWDAISTRGQLFCLIDPEGLTYVEVPSWGKMVRTVVFITCIVFIFICCLNIVIESLPQFAELRRPNFFSGVEWMCVAFFSVEWVVRFLVHPSWWQYLKTPLNILDLVSLIPFYLAQGNVIDSGISKWILMVRVLRLVRAVLFLERFEIVVITIRESTEVLALMFVILVIGLPIGGTCMYYAERGAWNATSDRWERVCMAYDSCTMERSPFQNAIDGMWFLVSTMTTLGYGDLYPKSTWGRVVAAVVMCLGVFVLAFPIMILAANFEEEQKKLDNEKHRNRAIKAAFLVGLQKENTAVVSQPSADDASPPAQLEGVLPLMKSIYFSYSNSRAPRVIQQTSKTQCRYEPLLFVRSDVKDHAPILHPSQKYPQELEMSLVLDEQPCRDQALAEINGLSMNITEEITEARALPMARLHVSLLQPKKPGELLSSIRLVNGVITEFPNEEVALRLETSCTSMDNQRMYDLQHALKRCRLAVVAACLQNDPVCLDVPVFMDLLASTNLMLEMAQHPQGLVYVTEQQVYSLVSGIHNMFDLHTPESSNNTSRNTEERPMIANVSEITTAVTKAVLQQAGTPCDDISELDEAAFLYCDVNPKQQYFGLFMSRLFAKDAHSDEPTIKCGNMEQKVLCQVVVKLVVPTYISKVIAL